jgi:DNA polymerase-3 subunit delta
MSLHPQQVLAELRAGKYAPVYFLQGEEPFYIDQISDYIEAHCIAEPEKGFNQTVLYGKDVTMGQVMTNARRFPMMAERQLVLVKEAKDIQDLDKEDGQKLLMDYLAQPLASTVLVFAHKHKKLDKRKQLAKAIEKQAVVLTTTKLYDNQVPQWIEDYVREKGLSIDPQATRLLSEYLGTNLERQSNEINKISLNLKEGQTITAELIQKYVGINKDFNAFELQKAMAMGDVVKANRIVNYFTANIKANSPIMVVAMIYPFYAKLLMAHASKDKSPAALARILRISPSMASREYLPAMNRISLAKAMQCIAILKETDLKAKGVEAGGMSQGDILKEMVFKLMH